MSFAERTGKRDLSYSAWHRPASIQRFIGRIAAQELMMVDIDAVECVARTREPVAMCETAIDIGQEIKPSTVTLKVARACNVPCFTVLYSLAKRANPADDHWLDIDQFRVKRIDSDIDADWTIYTPTEWARILCTLRNTNGEIPF